MKNGIKIHIITMLILCFTISLSYANETKIIRTSANDNVDREERETYLDESFEGWWTPSGWAASPLEGEGAWIQHNGSGVSGPGGLVYDGNYAAMFSNNYPYGTEGFLTTSEFDISAAVDPVIRFFWWNGDPNPNPSQLIISTSVDGEIFELFDTIDANLCGYNNWTEYLKPLNNDVIQVEIKAVSDQGGRDTCIDLFSIEEASTTPLAHLNFEYTYFGSAEINGSYDPFGEVFTLTNNSGGTLSVNSITDLSSENFATTFDTATTLSAFESYSFSFSYEPTSAEHDSLHFEIDTNGGVASIDLVGDAYELPEGLVEIGIGSETAVYLPFDPSSKYSYNQSLYLQSEIEMADESIESLYYYFNGDDAIEQDITIYMGHTEQDTLSDWIPSTELSIVFDGPISLTEEPGWVELPLTFPYPYNNTDNLVIAMDDNHGSSYYGSHFHCTNSSNNMSVYYKNYSNNPDPANPPAIGTGYSNAKLSTYRPNIRMQFDEELATANMLLNNDNAYYGNIETGNSYDPIGDIFTIMNNGPVALTITSITDLSGTDFSTDFDSSISLAFGESYSFGFEFTPQNSGNSSLSFEIVSNGGTNSITLSGDSYVLPDDTEEIGVGTIINSGLPTEINNRYTYTQTLYPAEELINPLAQIGKLLYHYDGGSAWSESVVVYMAHTNQDSLIDWMAISEMTKVYEGYLVTTEEDSWTEVTLHSPFNYNGTDNLVIAIDKNGVDNHVGEFYNSDTGENLSIYYANTNNNPDPQDPPNIGTGYNYGNLSTYIPNTRLVFQEQATTPNVALNSDSAYFDFIMAGNSSDPYGETFAIINSGGGTLTVNSVTDITESDFTSTFAMNDVSLEQGEAYYFGFTYNPVAGEHDSLYFEIDTNGGTVGINLTGDAYTLPDSMVEIGLEESSSNLYLPYDVSSAYSYGQTIYLQSEIEQADQQINSIYYHYNGYSAHTDELDIYMGHTADTTLTDWVPASDLNIVFSGLFDFPAEAGWVEIPLQVPFIYNNIDNLVIAIDENAAGSNYGNYAYCTENTENMSIYFKHYSNNTDPSDPPAVTNSYGGAYTSVNRPNIRIQFDEPYTTPVMNLNTDSAYYGYLETGSIADPIGENFTITNSGPGTLTVSNITDLSTSSFTTTFVADSVSLEIGESYSFGFTFQPTTEAHDETVFTIDSNGGTAEITLSGDAYQFSGDEIEIGVDELFTIALPIVPAANYSYSQSLYKQSELNLSGHEVTQIYYHFNGASAFTNDITLYMGHTSSDTLNSWIPNSEFMEVYSGAMTTHADNSWVRIVLDTPFFYNNVDNLIIAINDIGEESQSYSDQFYVSPSDINMSIIANSNDLVIDLDNLPEINNTFAGRNTVYRPNIRIQMELSPMAPTELAVTELGFASWLAPENVDSTREFTHYNVMIDGELAGTTTDLFWQFESLTAEQTYLVAITSQYEEGVSELIELEFTFNPATLQNLQVTSLGYGTWEAAANVDPTREFTHYIVMIDGELEGTTTDLFWQFENLVAEQTYLAAIISQYEEGESVPTELEFTFNPAAIQNLQVTSLGYATWEAASTRAITEYLSKSDALVSREFLNYNVYLDGAILGSTTDLFWQFDNLTDGQSYTASISSVYDEGESVLTELEFTFVLAAPINVTVDSATGLMTWINSSDMEEWLSYDNGINNDGIGTNGEADFEVASRWESSDISSYDGMIISKIRFFPRELDCEYSVRVWSGADAADLLVDQIVTDFINEEWNEIVLTTPVVIDASNELWLGYRVNTPAGFPAGTDAGPAAPGYGDNIRMAGGEWESISAAYDLDFNWNLAALVTNARGDEITLSPIVSSRSERANLNSVKHSNFTAGNLATIDCSVRDFTGYNVYFNGEQVAENISETEFLFENLINGTSYTGAVSTVYEEGESELIEVAFTYDGTGVENNVIAATALNGNYPNPFNPTTNISFSLKNMAKVSLVIYNIKGEKVKTLVNEQLEAGLHKLSWNGKDNYDCSVASGVYFYRMKCDDYEQTKKMMLLK